LAARQRHDKALAAACGKPHSVMSQTGQSPYGAAPELALTDGNFIAAAGWPVPAAGGACSQLA